MGVLLVPCSFCKRACLWHQTTLMNDTVTCYWPLTLLLVPVMSSLHISWRPHWSTPTAHLELHDAFVSTPQLAWFCNCQSLINVTGTSLGGWISILVLCTPVQWVTLRPIPAGVLLPTLPWLPHQVTSILLLPFNQGYESGHSPGCYMGNSLPSCSTWYLKPVNVLWVSRNPFPGWSHWWYWWWTPKSSMGATPWSTLLMLPFGLGTSPLMPSTGYMT